MKAACLTMMGMAEEALTALDALLEQSSGDLGLRCLRMQALVVAGDSRWRTELSAVEDPVREPRLHLAAAGALVAETPGREPDPEIALEVLDEIAELGEQEFADRTRFGPITAAEADEFFRDGSAPDPLARIPAVFREAKRSYFLLRADALLRTGDRRGAIGALERAEATGDVDRYARKLRERIWPR
jgi:hypothetical protein